MPSWSIQTMPVQPTDPYVAWVQQTGFIDLFAARQSQPEEEQWFPIILELADGVDLRQFVSEASAALGPGIRVPESYAHAPTGLDRLKFCTASVRKDAAESLATKDALRLIKRFEIGLPLKSVPQPTAWAQKQSVRSDAKVVTGIIDDGLAFANARFRRKNGDSRIEFLWNQDGTPLAPPDGWETGWELTRLGSGGVDGIDKLLTDASHAGIVDEDRVYRYDLRRHIDYLQPGHKPVAWRTAHGTHVMDLAAGYAPSEDASTRSIIGVQLPVATTADTSGATLTPYVLQGLWYILERAQLLSPSPLPIVVNLSYGLVAGPHNGSSVLESAIDQIIELRTQAKAPLHVVVPSGNSRLARCHARVAPLQGATHARRLNWRILPDDLTPSFTQIWLPESQGGPAVVSVRVTTPTGDTSPAITAGRECLWQDGTEILCKVLYLTKSVPGRTRPLIFIAVAPTATHHTTRKLAPSGVWEIEVTNIGSAIDPNNPIHAWIQRDDTPYGYPIRGRQSYFEDTLYVRFDAATGRVVELDDPTNPSPIKRDGTISAIATGKKSIVIGGFRRRDWRIARYSGGGPLVPPLRPPPITDGPDAMAVSDDSIAHRGLLATGTRSGSTVQLSGTSVAAPQFTRAIVEMLAAGAVTRQDVFKSVAVNVPAFSGVHNERNHPAYVDTSAPLPGEERRGAGRMEFPPKVHVHSKRYEKT